VIVDERMRVYLNSLDAGHTPFLEELLENALEQGVPVIRREMQSFMKMLLALYKPQRILEVGTAVGFSTLLMCEYGPQNLQITTIENYEKRIPVAKENFRRAGREAQITLLEGDAGEILKKLDGSFDMIFMDAAKGQYIHWLPDILRLLKAGGVLLSDNVLQEGDIIESHYLVERRNRTIYKRMREYLHELTHNKALVTSVIPLGDGVTVSVKQE
jgi:predicted O-methyltransferase YrrM